MKQVFGGQMSVLSPNRQCQRKHEALITAHTFLFHDQTPERTLFTPVPPRYTGTHRISSGINTFSVMANEYWMKCSISWQQYTRSSPGQTQCRCRCTDVVQQTPVSTDPLSPAACQMQWLQACQIKQPDQFIKSTKKLQHITVY